MREEGERERESWEKAKTRDSKICLLSVFRFLWFSLMYIRCGAAMPHIVLVTKWVQYNTNDAFLCREC